MLAVTDKLADPLKLTSAQRDVLRSVLTIAQKLGNPGSPHHLSGNTVLDDHLLGDRRVAESLFEGMKGMRRLFQGAATEDSISRGDLIERAAEAGLRSIFVDFETLAPENLRRSNKRQNR